MDLPILYEDADMVVIHKPVGVMTHPDGRTNAKTVSDWFAATYPDAKEVGEAQRLADGTELVRPGVVHRLDADTSGALVLAKNQAAYTFLKNAFQKRDIKKIYLAFVYGVPKEKMGVIDFDIGRSRKDFRLRSAQPKAKGILRDAITRYQVLSDIGTHALLKAYPETGRTHQIRVHLKAIHHPIVCDKLYAPNRVCDLRFDRLGLHAYEIDLPLPAGERVTVVAPPPPDLMAAITLFPDAVAILNGTKKGFAL
ncbi:MAG TPA: RluA family pseudouridine synthase [Candidatus Paceibacterota bacterium]|nr:RluA family pseudouridine synthase [Candidatus Paceibacterota bacterium]